MLSPDFNRRLAANASDASVLPPDEYGGRRNPLRTGLPPDRGTSHFSIVDADRNAVAMTTTVNTGFGSKVVASCGIVLNNEMDDFSTPGQPNTYGLAPSAANYIRPGKRPLSSMSPTIVLQEQAVNGVLTPAVRAVVGASGGPRIISTVVQVLIRLLLRGSGALAAVNMPRVHHQFIPNVVYAEDWETLDKTVEAIPQYIIDGLRERGHVVETWAKHGVAQLVVQDLDTGELHAVSDHRKSGVPAGYD